MEAAKRPGGLPRRVAHLTVREGPAQPFRNVWQPLFDPRLASMEGEVLVLGGIELHIGETADAIFETYQLWRCVRYVGGVTVSDVHAPAGTMSAVK